MSTIEEVREKIQSFGRKTIEVEFLPSTALLSSYNNNDVNEFHRRCLEEVERYKALPNNIIYEYGDKISFKLDISDGYIEEVWLIIERAETDEEWEDRIVAEVQAEERKQELRKKEIEAAERLLESQGYLIQKNFFDPNNIKYMGKTIE